MSLHEKKVVAVLPAYNAEKTLQATFDDIPKDWVDEILLVDDCSRDRTVELAQALPMRVVVHPKNRGYGGNQKTCYRTAMDEMGGEIMVMVHPDHQYDPKIIPELVKPLLRGDSDSVFDTEIIAQGVAKGMRIREVPISTRYFDEASQIGFWRSVRYGLEILKTMVLYKMHKKRIWSHRIFKDPARVTALPKESIS